MECLRKITAHDFNIPFVAVQVYYKSMYMQLISHTLSY